MLKRFQLVFETTNGYNPNSFGFREGGMEARIAKIETDLAVINARISNSIWWLGAIAALLVGAFGVTIYRLPDVVLEALKTEAVAKTVVQIEALKDGAQADADAVAKIRQKLSATVLYQCPYDTNVDVGGNPA